MSMFKEVLKGVLKRLCKEATVSVLFASTQCLCNSVKHAVFHFSILLSLQSFSVTSMQSSSGSSAASSIYTCTTSKLHSRFWNSC